MTSCDLKLILLATMKDHQTATALAWLAASTTLILQLQMMFQPTEQSQPVMQSKSHNDQIQEYMAR